MLDKEHLLDRKRKLNSPGTLLLVVMGLAWFLAIPCGCQLEDRNPLPAAARGPQYNNISDAEEAQAKDAPEPKIEVATRFAAARLFESTHQFEDAVKQYEAIVAADPKHVDSYHRMGILQGLLGRHADAENALRRAVQLSPNNASIRNNLAFGFILQKRWSEAEQELLRALKLDPRDRQAITNLGLALCGQERYDEALDQYRRVLPESDAHYNLGLAYRMHRRHIEARDTFLRVLALNPEFEAARQQLASLQNQLRANDQSKSDTRDSAPKPIVRLVDSSPDVIVNTPLSPANGGVEAGMTDAEFVANQLTPAVGGIEAGMTDAEFVANQLTPANGGLENVPMDAELVATESIEDDEADRLAEVWLDTTDVVETDDQQDPNQPPAEPSASAFTGEVELRPALRFPEQSASPTAFQVGPPLSVPANVKIAGRSPIGINSPHSIRGDLDGDEDVDYDDLAILGKCCGGAGLAPRADCQAADLDADSDVDLLDYQILHTILHAVSNR